MSAEGALVRDLADKARRAPLWDKEAAITALISAVINWLESLEERISKLEGKNDGKAS